MCLGVLVFAQTHKQMNIWCIHCEPPSPLHSEVEIQATHLSYHNFAINSSDL
jgi:hypothetical protein